MFRLVRLGTGHNQGRIMEIRMEEHKGWKERKGGKTSSHDHLLSKISRPAVHETRFTTFSKYALLGKRDILVCLDPLIPHSFLLRSRQKDFSGKSTARYSITPSVILIRVGQSEADFR
jgi:hypothetical protein